MNKKNFTGFVLAGGKSSRMKTDKAFLEIEGETFIERAFKTLKSVCGRQTSIILNAEQKVFGEKISLDADFVFDVYENRGALGGIHAALKNCRSEFAIILAVDLPFVEAETINYLSQAAQCEKEFSAVVPRQRDGRLQPLCAVYKVADCLHKAENLLSKNISVSMREFLETVTVKIVEEESLSDNPNIFANINTPAEYEKLTTVQ
jgi:molybdopterin-guanine dinucleotide biosynthesis protein A